MSLPYVALCEVEPPSSGCQYSGGYATADLCKVFALVLDGNHLFITPRLIKDSPSRKFTW